MNTGLNFERCHSFVQCQLNAPATHEERAGATVRAITISRQAGCGALVVAQRLATLLHERAHEEVEKWTIFDRNLVEEVLKDHGLPQDLEKYMRERSVTGIDDTMEELFGLHPPTWILARQTAETILRLAHLGNVIIIGRGGNIITARLPFVLNVRLVAPLEERILRIEQTDKLDRKHALAFINEADSGRRKYLRKYYKADIDDPLGYDVVVNTGALGYEGTARMLADLVMASVEEPTRYHFAPAH